MAPLEQALRRPRIAFGSINDRTVRRFDWTRAHARPLPMHGAKGLAFAHAFVAGLQALPMRDEPLDDALRLLCVAITRATNRLGPAACGSSPVAASARDHVRARFSQALP